jgi:intergrase/recombinase
VVFAEININRHSKSSNQIRSFQFFVEKEGILRKDLAKREVHHQLEKAHKTWQVLVVHAELSVMLCVCRQKKERRKLYQSTVCLLLNLIISCGYLLYHDLSLLQANHLLSGKLELGPESQPDLPSAMSL